MHDRVNIVQHIMYRAAYPFAVLLNRLRLSPNQITTLSVLLAVLAFLALILDSGQGWFALFWALSMLLDFCDGTVARMTGRVNDRAFRYDHMSDLFKLSLLFVGVGIRYASDFVWILSASTVFLFLYYSMLTHDVLHVRKLLALRAGNEGKDEVPDLPPESAQEPAARLRERYALVAWIVRHDLLHRAIRLSWGPLTTISGHSLLLLFLLPLGPVPASAVLIYLGLLSLLGIRSRIAELLSLAKP